MGSSHDSHFRSTFAQVEQADSLLRGLLPATLAATLDSCTLQPVPATATGSGLRLQHGDLLYLAFPVGPDAPLFLLLEHKSYREARLMRPLLRYVVHLTEAWLQQHGTLPHVLPVVLHHGRRPMAPLSWRPPAAQRRVPVAWHPHDPLLQPVCIDLNSLTERELRARVTAPLACLTLLCLRQLPRRDPVSATAALQRWADLVRRVEAERGGQTALEQLSCYLMRVTELTQEQLGALMEPILGNPDRSYLMSTANRLRAEGRAEGRAESEKAALAAAQTRLLRQLAIRFGAVPQDLEARVQRGTSEDLDLWSVRLLLAGSLAEVFAGE